MIYIFIYICDIYFKNDVYGKYGKYDFKKLYIYMIYMVYMM